MAGKDKPVDNGNGRVTMAVLGTKVDTVLKRLDQIEDKIDLIPAHETQIKDLQKHVDNLETKSDRWNLLNTLGAIIGTIIGSIFGQTRL